MPGFQWHMPLDPTCPDVEKFNRECMDDPMMAYSGCASEFAEDFHARHLSKCKRCQEHGTANIEVVGP